MGREALGRAFDLDGAFNDVVLRLEPGANERAVASDIDRLLERYGGRGAYGRDRMLSAQFLADELTSLTTMACDPAALLPAGGGVPAERFAVAAGGDRARQHRPAEVLRLHRCAASPGTTPSSRWSSPCWARIVGMALGVWVGNYVAAIYANIYRIPGLHFNAGPRVYLGGPGRRVRCGAGRRSAGRAACDAPATGRSAGAAGADQLSADSGARNGTGRRAPRWQVTDGGAAHRAVSRAAR